MEASIVRLEQLAERDLLPLTRPDEVDVMRRIVVVSLWIVAIIHLLPLSGVLGAHRLSSLYGINFDEPTTLLLMRHQAVLFGLLGCFMIAAVFRRTLRWPALALGAGSVLSFLALTFVGGPFASQMGRVVLVDWVALASLAAGAIAQAAETTSNRADLRASQIA
jgi:hypothetical protein